MYVSHLTLHDFRSYAAADVPLEPGVTAFIGRNGQGAQVGERFDPFQRVGVYIPGGTAPLVSTAIMTVRSRSSTNCFTCGTPLRAVTFQSMVRTSSPG